MKLLPLVVALATAISPLGIATSKGARTSAEADNRDARKEIAAKLVDLVNPEDALLAQELRGWEHAVDQFLTNDPAIAKLAVEFPRIREVAKDAGRPIASEYLRSVVRKLREFKVNEAARALTLADLREAHVFFSSPIGRKFVQHALDPKAADRTVDRMTKRANEGGEFTFTEQDLAKGVKEVTGAAISDASPAEIVALMRFESSAAGKKLRELGEAAQKYIIDLANSPDPKFLERQQKAMTDAMLIHIQGAR